MKQKQYEFLFLEEWELEKLAFDKKSLGERIADRGREGWYIVAIDYIKKDKKLYRVVVMQREIE